MVPYSLAAPPSVRDGRLVELCDGRTRGPASTVAHLTAMSTLIGYLGRVARARARSTTTVRTACRCPAARTSRPSSPASPRTSSCSSAPPRRAPTSFSCTTGCSGRGPPRRPRPRRQAPAAAPLRRTTWRWPRTTCRSTPTPSTATTRCSPRRWAASACDPFARHRGRTVGVAGRLPGDGLDPHELVARVREATGREPLAFTDGPERVRTVGIVSGAGAGPPRGRDRRGPRRVPHRRAAERVMSAARASRRPLRRRRPLRDRDVRRAPPRRPARATGSACDTASSTFPTRSERACTPVVYRRFRLVRRILVADIRADRYMCTRGQ